MFLYLKLKRSISLELLGGYLRACNALLRLVDDDLRDVGKLDTTQLLMTARLLWMRWLICNISHTVGLRSK